MKRNYLFGVNRPLSFLFGLALILSLSNCKKTGPESETEIPYVAKNETTIVFSLASIEDTPDIADHHSNGDASASGNRLQQVKKVSAQSEIVSLGDVDAIMTISEDIPEEYKRKVIIGSSTKTSSNAENKAARVLVNLESGVTYRVVLYTDNGSGAPGTYVGQAQGIVGSAAVSIPANRNTKYVWYAYTYNNTRDIPEYANTPTPTYTIPIYPTSNSTSYRHDFAYSKGLITTSNVVNGTNPINNLVLTRKTSKIIVELNSRGMFAPVTYASLRFTDDSGMATASFSLRDSSLSSISQSISSLTRVYNHNSSAYVVPVGTDSVLNLNTKKRYTFYTPTNGLETRSFTVTIDSIILTSQRVNEDNTNSVTPQTTAVERMFSNKTFSFPGFVARPGKSYLLSIKLVESPVTVGNTKWARADLWRDATAANTSIGLRQAYKFRYDNPVYNTRTAVPAGDYFTNDIYSIGTTGKNICELVYPEGTWDLPTTTQIDELHNLQNKEQPELSNYRWYLKINPGTLALGAPAYPNGFLSFSPIGYKTSIGGPTIDFNPGDPVNYGQTHGYWRTKTQETFAQSLNGSFQGVMMSNHNMSATTLTPIRCVRK
ncbi:hypothetical protein [Sphingobacterium sp. BN32]|uniref:hypothetical protein n=1 Tax=Sphingobacterium sp. BN32 TaxID=3058432 RepID=UPI00265CB184|nr:hypothetical protein [Sphingobacterium sp. BN32]WKK59472.1 hypothetical protein QYC40_04395 [Sphingobacterium sp. BN32]